MDTLAKRALQSSYRWLSSSDSSYKLEAYDIAVYELEMAGEVALKGLLLEKHYDVPKRHNVSRIIRTLIHDIQIASEDKASKLEDYLDQFDHVVRMRGDAGYSYENSMELEGFKEIYDNYYESVKELIDLVSDMLTKLE